jgi:hypothetical protein
VTTPSNEALLTELRDALVGKTFRMENIGGVYSFAILGLTEKEADVVAKFMEGLYAKQ